MAEAPSPKPLARLYRYLLPYRGKLFVALGCLVLSTPAELFHPLVWKYVVDEVLVANQPQKLLPALAVMLGVQLLGVALSTWRGYLVGTVGQSFVVDIRNEVYEKIQSHSLQFFHDRRSGDLMARAVGDVDTLQEVAVNGVDTVVSQALQFVVVAGILLSLNAVVGAATLLPMLGVGLLVWVFNSRVRGLYRRVRDRLGDVSAKLQENLLGILVIKAFAREQHELERFRAENEGYLREAMKQVVARNVYFPAVRSTGFLASVAMLGVGAWFYFRGTFTLGDLVAYRGYWWYLFAPVFQLATVNEMLQRAIASASRIFELLDEPLEINDAADAIVLEHPRGHIVCEGLSFAYTERDTTLRSLDFEIEPGHSIGVVGPSGAGKSTLISLLLRLYDPDRGRILLDGHDLRDLTQQSLREPYAVVTQEPFLFNDTVRANITYGRPDASEDELVEACRQANALEFIHGLPQGFDTVVGERGVKLSGGQKQRLCVARAFLVNPTILLLDEPTAAVEPESEAIIQAALERLMEGRTALVVSHRLSMVRDSDQILVIEDGAITERGTHDELMARPGWYARMYRLQMGEADSQGSERGLTEG